MPEYLAPGVYVEEVSYRSKSIEGVSTTTTGFVGPARYGPFDLEPDVITSLGEFERTYGNGDRLQFEDGSEMDNYLWHGVRAFFSEGGRRLYVSRVWHAGNRREEGVPEALTGFARETVRKGQPTSAQDAIQVWARYPGLAGNFRVRFTLRLGQNIFAVENPGTTTARPRVRGLVDFDVVHISDAGSPPLSDGFYVAESYFSETTKEREWRFHPEGGGAAIELQTFSPVPNVTQVRLVTMTVSVMPPGEDVSLGVWDSLPLDPRHERAGTPDSMFATFAHNPGRLAPGETMVNIGPARTLPIRLECGDDLETGLDVLRDAFFAELAALETELLDEDSSDLERSLEITLRGGNDGQRPDAGDYEGKEDVLGIGLATIKTGLKTFEDIEDISIVAAPGSTFGYENGYGNDAKTIINLLIQHAQKMRYRIAVLDSGERQSISEVRALRAQIDSTYAALYYPWVRILDPVTGKENYMPPSGFVAGIYCRNDIERAVYKAPANEVVNLSIGFEQLLNKSQQDILNPEGINCFRFFEGRGFRLWGARTISSDPEWKYVNLRRYFAYLERSIDKGTQWAVFEPNGEKLWGNVRRTIEDFLLNEWMTGALLGDKPEKAFFVRCDRSTMTQNDLDNGRLVCTIGIAPLRPAEYVIFRIGQWTADRKV
jgi:phage tail sheath protein FI